MITEIKLEGATGNEEAPLLDLAAMLEEAAAELKLSHEEHDPAKLPPRQVHFGWKDGLKGPDILTTTDDGETVATVTVHPDLPGGKEEL